MPMPKEIANLEKKLAASICVCGHRRDKHSRYGMFACVHVVKRVRRVTKGSRRQIMCSCGRFKAKAVVAPKTIAIAEGGE